MNSQKIEDYKAVLAAPMGQNDANAPDVRSYLKALLYNVWREGERFSGKRPFGNSGWEYDLYAALIGAALCPGSLDEDGSVQDVDRDTASKLIFGAIASL